MNLPIKPYRFGYILCILLLLTKGCGSDKNKENKLKPATLAMDKFVQYNTYEPTVPVYRISSGAVLNRFFDTSPISPSGRYAALFRLPFENKSPSPGDKGEIVWIDLKDGTEKIIAQSRGWEVQMGANVQWGGNDSTIFYNDVDTTNWKAFSVKLNPFTGERKRLQGTVFMASTDGKKLASHDLVKSRLAQVGYGVIVPDSLVVKNIGPSRDDGVFVTDTDTGEEQLLISIADMYENTEPSIKLPNPEDYEYYCFQVKWNPQGTKLLTTVQWTPLDGSSGRRRAVVTMDTDGTNLRTAVSPDLWAKGGHHINWFPDGEHITMNLNIDDDPGLEIIKARYDGTEMHEVFPEGSGHPSFHKEGRYIITDAYPNEELAFGDSTVPIRLIDTKLQKEVCIARIYVSDTPSEFRIDPHPAWDRSGKYVVFNGFVDDTRQVYLADVSELLE